MGTDTGILVGVWISGVDLDLEGVGLGFWDFEWVDLAGVVDLAVVDLAVVGLAEVVVGTVAQPVSVLELTWVGTEVVETHCD